MMQHNATSVVTHIISGDIWAGAEAQAFQLIQGLKANGLVRPTAIVFNRGILMDRLLESGVSVTCADESRLSPFGIIRMIGLHLREHQTQIVHTHGFKENVLGTFAQKLNRVPHSVRTVHGNPEANESWRVPRQKLTRLLDQLVGRFGQDAIIAVSSQLEARISKLYPGKTTKIYNFIDLADTNAKDDAQVSANFLDKTTLTLGIIGRLVPVKRIDLFIDSVALLQRRLPLQIKGIIIGDGPLRSSLEMRVRNQNLESQIKFKGFITDIQQEIQKLDAILMTSDHEGLPMVVLEALAGRVPVIAHNVGGIPEILNHGQAGILVEDHTAKGYADKIELLLSDPSKVAKITESGYTHLTQEFSMQRNIKQYQNLYAELPQ